ncbi:SRPBCC family protein [bacterium]|nr:SRPBCC family protein [bacterium]
MRRWFKLLPWIAGLAGYMIKLRPKMIRWHATDEEVNASRPGDEIVPDPAFRTTRAISIQAPPYRVWPWLVQLGQGRGGFYSYDWIENLFGYDIHSADEIIGEWQGLEVGDMIRMSPGIGPQTRVEAITPNHDLILKFLIVEKMEGGPDGGPLISEEWPGTWSFHVRPQGASGSRLVVRTRYARHPSFVMGLFYRVVIEPLHFIMEQKMLRGIKERAEKN